MDGNNNLRPQPLCPTRFLLRVRSFRAVRENYSVLLQLMEDIGMSTDACAAKAYGIYQQLLNPETYFCFLLCLELFQYLENLSNALQSATISVSAAVEAAGKVEKTLLAHATDTDFFDKIWNSTVQAVSTYSLNQPKLPRTRRVPKRLESSIPSPQNFRTVKDMYRSIYTAAYNAASEELKARFSQPGITQVVNIEKLIMNWSKDDHPLEAEELVYLCKTYELDQQRLLANLNTLKFSGLTFISMSELVKHFRKMHQETRCLYSELIKLVKILLLLPITSCSAERSFSVMNRIKSYLRSTMGQERLNNLCLLHAYPEV